MRSFIGFALFALATGACINACSDAWSQAPETEVETPTLAPVRTAEVTEEQVANVRRVRGQLAPRPGVDLAVSAPFDCRLVDVHALPDSVAARGASLFAIAPTAAARAAADEARADRDAARAQADAIAALFDRRVTTSDVMAGARAELTRAEARYDTARAGGLGSIDELFAPDDVLVVDVDVASGDQVAAGTRLARLRPVNAVEAVLGVEARDLARLAPGDPVVVTSSERAFEPMSGTITRIASEVDPTTRRVPVHVAVPPGPAVIAGLLVTGEFHMAPRRSLVVPHAALTPRADGLVVYVARDGRAAEVPVEVDIDVDGRAAVRAEGLVAGDQVIVEGNYQLDDGMAVEVAR